MIFYITYNDQPSGIYSSQVIDVVKFLRRTFNLKINLVAIISLRGFRTNRMVIKQQLPGAIVLPMFPKLKNWRWNVLMLFCCFLLKSPSTVICRNAIPTQLALYLKKCRLVRKVIYDARGVEYEQMKEYAMISDESLMHEVFECEKAAVLKSNFQIAVTNALVKYWNEKYAYNRQTFVVIPCTLNSSKLNLPDEYVLAKRTDVGFEDSDIVVVYSGSTSTWQSFRLILEFLETQLPQNPNLKLLMLTKLNSEIQFIIEKHKGRVFQKWCNENEVQSYLRLADYGILLRESSLTNRVASPVKFAEYLYAGLDVIISENLEDYVDFLKEHNCGVVYSNQSIKLSGLNLNKRILNSEIAKGYLSKDSDLIQAKYKAIVDNI